MNNDVNKKPKHNIVCHFAQKTSCKITNDLSTFLEGRNKQAKTNVRVNINVAKISTEKPLFEVKIMLDVTADIEEKQMYDASFVYIVLADVSEDLTIDQQKKVVMVAVPTQMFPLLAAIATNNLRDCGCGSVIFNNMDFEDLYNKQESSATPVESANANNDNSSNI